MIRPIQTAWRSAQTWLSRLLRGTTRVPASRPCYHFVVIHETGGKDLHIKAGRAEEFSPVRRPFRIGNTAECNVKIEMDNPGKVEFNAFRSCERTYVINECDPQIPVWLGPEKIWKDPSDPHATFRPGHYCLVARFGNPFEIRVGQTRFSTCVSHEPFRLNRDFWPANVIRSCAKAQTGWTRGQAAFKERTGQANDGNSDG